MFKREKRSRFLSFLLSLILRSENFTQKCKFAAKSASQNTVNYSLGVKLETKSVFGK